MEEKIVVQVPVVWLHLSSCTGCSVTILNAVSPSIKNIIVDELIPQRKVNLLFQEAVMAASGEPALRILKRASADEKGKYVLVVEGAVPVKDNGVFGSIGEEKGKPRTMSSLAEELAQNSVFIIALGTCACFGGISAASPNPTGSVGMGEFLKLKKINKPLVNISGCPPHPDWFVSTVADVLLRGLPKQEELDEFNRPKRIYGKLIHENCPRRADFDAGKFAQRLSAEGCLYLLGCKGPTTYADCPLRQWNNGVNWCIRAGMPCLGCCEPEFPDVNAPYYEKSIFTPLEGDQ